MKGNAVLAEIDPRQPLVAYPGKSCGLCTACCSTVPVKEIGVGAFARCPHLRSLPDVTTGCSIYRDRPYSCRSWSCSWLISDLPEKYKPSRIGVVIDPIPDMIRVNGKEHVASQLWVVPGHEEDFRTVDAVVDLIWSIFDLGFAVLWRIKAEGGQRSRVMMLIDGKWAVSEAVHGETHIPGFANDGERLLHAQQLIQGGKR
jgi:hypothetical protein